MTDVAAQSNVASATPDTMAWDSRARRVVMIYLPLACFILILLLLYGALGSVRDAAIVFTGVPFALVGGVLLLFLRGMDGSDQGIWKWDIDTALLSTFVERITKS